jgi:hypothetical protein
MGSARLTVVGEVSTLFDEAHVAAAGRWRVEGHIAAADDDDCEEPAAAAHAPRSIPPGHDNHVSGADDGRDVLAVLLHWGACADRARVGAPCPADINGDGIVDGDDLLLALSQPRDR